MKKTHALVAALALAAGLSAGTARAQLAVIDGANVAQTMQAVATAAKELAQLQMQLQQLQNTYRMFTNPTNITGMLPGLNTGMLRNPMPTSGQVPGMVMGMNGSLSGPGQSFLNQNQLYKPAGSDPLATQMNRSAMAIAQIQGMAATNLQSIEQRLANLSAMQTQLQSATDIKQVTAINGRIAIEQHAIQSQQAQATNLQTMAVAQIAAQQQQDQQLIRQGWDQLAAQFAGASVQ
jgi:type IV secretion system protein VirB5